MIDKDKKMQLTAKDNRKNNSRQQQAETHFECHVCHAHATGFHFNAQSCQACCAFFRRTVSLRREYKCKLKEKSGNGTIASSAAMASCSIHYSEKTLCRACRLEKCLAIGMDKCAVQATAEKQIKERTYFTKSGLLRNKRFARGALKLFDDDHNGTCNDGAAAAICDSMNAIQPSDSKSPKQQERQQQQQKLNQVKENGTINGGSQSHSVAPSPSPSVSTIISSHHCCANESIENSSKVCSSKCSISSCSSSMAQHHQQQLLLLLPPDDDNKPSPQPIRLSTTPQWNLLALLVDEEMRIGERRRILFCERPVTSLLGKNKTCPFTHDDIKPLRFQEFRRTIRCHILLIYEWLRVWPGYDHLRMDDQITLLRKCVLYHTVLDPCFLTIQVGDLGKFVLPNGGYVSTKYPPVDEGWADEPEISHETKVKIYWPLLVPLMSGCVAPMLRLGLKFEEFVALKAIVSLQMTLADISFTGRALVSRELESLCRALCQFYTSQPEYADDQLGMAERFGNLLLLLTPIIDTANTFVESHHIVQFFDLWQMDSLMLQFLQKKEC